MIKAFEKSAIKSIGFTLSVTAIYLGSSCNKNFIMVIYISLTLSFIVVYLWSSYHTFKDRDKELNKTLQMNTNLKLKIEINESDLKKLNENNKGLIDERKEYQRRIDNKENKIYELKEEIRNLQNRVLFNEGRNHYEI